MKGYKCYKYTLDLELIRGLVDYIIDSDPEMNLTREKTKTKAIVSSMDDH